MGSESESKLWGYLQTVGATQDSLEQIPLLRLLHPRKLALRDQKGRLAAEAEQRQREDDMVAELIAMVALWSGDTLGF